MLLFVLDPTAFRIDTQSIESRQLKQFVDATSPIDGDSPADGDSSFELSQLITHEFWETLTVFVYFAAVTLSTLGYGDISPISNVAKLVVSANVVTFIVSFTAIVSKLATPDCPNAPSHKCLEHDKDGRSDTD
jgi:hypothetical protein